MKNNGVFNMEFNLVKELNGKFDPIVFIKTDELPADATCPKPGKGGCVMAFISQTIALRKTTAFGRENITCGGVATGLGWGNGFNSEKDLDFQATFLSNGVDSAKDKEEFLKRLENRPPHVQEMFTKGERIYCDFETAKEHIQKRPIFDDKQYVVFKAIENLEEGEIPDSVVFTLNAMEFSALLQLNNSFRSEDAYIKTPQAAACQAMGSFTFIENEKDEPDLVLSPIDFAARAHMKHFIPNDYMNISMPWKLFLKLDELSKKSVFQTHFWKDFGNKEKMD